MSLHRHDRAVAGHSGSFPSSNSSSTARSFWRNDAASETAPCSTTTTTIEIDSGADLHRSGSTTPKRRTSFDDDADEFKRMRRTSCPDIALDELLDDSASASGAHSPLASPRVGAASTTNSSSSASSVLSLSLAPLHISSPPPPPPALRSALRNSDSTRSRGSGTTSSPSLSSPPSLALDAGAQPPPPICPLLWSPTKSSPTHASPRDRLTAEFERHRADRRARAAVLQASFGEALSSASRRVVVAATSSSSPVVAGRLPPTLSPPNQPQQQQQPQPPIANPFDVPTAAARSIFGFDGSRLSRSRRTARRQALSSTTGDIDDLDLDDDDDDEDDDDDVDVERARLQQRALRPSPPAPTPSFATFVAAQANDSSMLPAISVDAAAQLLLGARAFLCGTDDVDVIAIDCRFPYEYNGGHLVGAVNLYTKDDAERYFFGRQAAAAAAAAGERRRIFLFHCEFSSHRGPALLRHVRAVDRRINSHRYPLMSCPDLYLIAGGYEAFCERFAPEAAARGRRASRDSFDSAHTSLRRTSRPFVSANEPRSSLSAAAAGAAATGTPPRSASSLGNTGMPDSFMLLPTPHATLAEPVPLERLFAPHEPPLYTPMDDRRFCNERREFMRAIRRTTVRRSQSMFDFAAVSNQQQLQRLQHQQQQQQHQHQQLQQQQSVQSSASENQQANAAVNVGDQPVRLKVIVHGDSLMRELDFAPSQSVQHNVDTLVRSLGLDASQTWVLFNPDPSVDLSVQYLEPAQPLKLYAFRAGQQVELRLAPITVDVYHANRNSNQMNALVGPVQMRLDRHSELVFNVRRFKQAVKSLNPDDEYTFALVEQLPKDKFRALWINANTSPEMNHLTHGSKLLLWPISIFEAKSAESLKEPLIAGYVKMTKQENIGAAHKRFVLVKFNIMFYFETNKSKEPKGVVNLEHYMLSPIEQPKKKLYVIRFEKVALSFAPRPKLYQFTFDDLKIAEQWHRAVIGECANRMAGTKLPPPRIDIDDVKLPPLLKKLPPPLELPANFPVEDIDAPSTPYVPPVVGSNSDNSMMSAQGDRASVMFASPGAAAAVTASGAPPSMPVGIPAAAPAAAPHDSFAAARSPPRVMPPGVGSGMPPPGVGVGGGGMPPPGVGVGMPPPVVGRIAPPPGRVAPPGVMRRDAPPPGMRGPGPVMPAPMNGAPPPMGMGGATAPPPMGMGGATAPPPIVDRPPPMGMGGAPPPIVDRPPPMGGGGAGGVPPPMGGMPPPLGGAVPPLGVPGGAMPPIVRRMRGRDGGTPPGSFRAPATRGPGPMMSTSGDSLPPPPSPGVEEQSTSSGSIPEALIGGGSGSPSPQPGTTPPGAGPPPPIVRRPSENEGAPGSSTPPPPMRSDAAAAPPPARIGGSMTYSPRTGRRPSDGGFPNSPVARRPGVQTLQPRSSMPSPTAGMPPPMRAAPPGRAMPGRDPRRSATFSASNELPPPMDGGGGGSFPPPIASSLPPSAAAAQSAYGALPSPLDGGPPMSFPPPMGGGGGGPPDIEVVVAVYDYEAPGLLNDRGEGAISFKQGERLRISERRDDGWLKGRNEAGQIGLIPGLYTQASS